MEHFNSNYTPALQVLMFIAVYLKKLPVAYQSNSCLCTSKSCVFCQKGNLDSLLHWHLYYISHLTAQHKTRRHEF